MDRVHHIPAGAARSDTAQTQGMQRRAAISSSSVGSQAIFMGETRVAPSTSSGPHHHGSSETCIYVVAGTPEFVYKDENSEVTIATKPGDYVYIPPFVPHIEANPSPNEEAVVVLARSTQEAIVENLPEL
jgi:uncharacterized RmlC-like cupin family protein